jgi:hypothetical protein
MKPLIMYCLYFSIITSVIGQNVLLVGLESTFICGIHLIREGLCFTPMQIRGNVTLLTFLIFMV